MSDEIVILDGETLAGTEWERPAAPPPSVSPPTPSPSAAPTITRESAKAAIKAMFADKADAFHRPHDPDHRERIDEYLRLSAIANQPPSPADDLRRALDKIDPPVPKPTPPPPESWDGAIKFPSAWGSAEQAQYIRTAAELGASPREAAIFLGFAQVAEERERRAEQVEVNRQDLGPEIGAAPAEPPSAYWAASEADRQILRKATANLSQQAKQFLDPLLHDRACFDYALELAKRPRRGIRP
jgi:hypothetical protein